VLRCVLFEDDHLLVVNKPAGMNTHAPGPYAGEGLYDWLRHREPRWAALAIIHRLDKETSGVMVFAKSPRANRSLTEQFAGRTVQKRYLLLTDRAPPQNQWRRVSRLTRVGNRYASRPGRRDEEGLAETHFRVRDRRQEHWLVEAIPLTGRTHQVRVHAAESGFPILGDVLYGGGAARRLFLHSAALALRHPATNALRVFTADPDFETDPWLALREALIDPEETNAFRLVHGASDGWPGWYVDRLGDFLLSHAAAPAPAAAGGVLAGMMTAVGAKGAYHRTLSRERCAASAAGRSAEHRLGAEAPEQFEVRENGLRFTLSFREGFSPGLFLDQRDNRHRVLTGHVAAGFPWFRSELGTRGSEARILNAFAYTCGFSVCAALAGARVTSLDLSRKYLDWGRENFRRNGLDPAAHEFLDGDVFDWLKRLAKKGRAYDAVVLDPPTFSRSKQRGAFRVERDFGALVTGALPLVRPGGVLFASTNAASLAPEKWVGQVTRAIQSSGRAVAQQHYAPQAPDFPISRGEPAYLKTLWLRIE
jgi:23S rRNA (cytosine1962-C5)-methyltransferase